MKDEDLLWSISTPEITRVEVHKPKPRCRERMSRNGVTALLHRAVSKHSSTESAPGCQRLLPTAE